MQRTSKESAKQIQTIHWDKIIKADYNISNNQIVDWAGLDPGIANLKIKNKYNKQSTQTISRYCLFYNKIKNDIYQNRQMKLYKYEKKCQLKRSLGISDKALLRSMSRFDK